jgi:beta-glucosidase
LNLNIFSRELGFKLLFLFAISIIISSVISVPINVNGHTRDDDYHDKSNYNYGWHYSEAAQGALKSTQSNPVTHSEPVVRHIQASEDCFNGFDDDGDLLIDTEDDDCTNSAPGQLPPPPEEVCGNAVDDDNDGSVDEGCAPPPSPPEEVCGNAVDDDNDGSVDEGCAPPPSPPEEVCGDGIDNNGDGQTDEGCAAPATPQEQPAQEICEDNVDNNQNDKIDEGCAAPSSPTEGKKPEEKSIKPEQPEQQPQLKSEDCANGIDDDGDALPDEYDDDCQSKSIKPEQAEQQPQPQQGIVTSVEICGNGIDDDGDALLDEGCPSPSSQLAKEICGDGIDNTGDQIKDEGCPGSKNVINNEHQFLWGASTAPYQVEGGITNNDWDFFTKTQEIKQRVYDLTAPSIFYKGPRIILQPAGQAVKEWDANYYERDFDNAKKLGMNAFRIGIEWSRVEPENDNWNYEAIQHYKQMISSMRERGLTPIVTLNHFTLPLWVLTPPTTFTKLPTQNIWPVPLNHIPLSEPPQTDGYWNSLRGWENPRTVDEFVEFVNKIVPELKDQVDYWITFNEPVGTYLGLGYLSGFWPPGFVLDGKRAANVLHNLILAHVKAYDKISILDDKDSDGDGIAKSVGFSHAMTFVKPASSIELLGLNINNQAANNFNYFTNDYFINAVVNGKEDLNYLNTLQRKPTQQEWKDKADFIGVNYYRGLYVYYHPIVAASAAKFIGGVPLNDLRYEKQPHALLNDLGWEIYPEGLYKTLMHIKNQWNIPVIITENGIADRNGDKRGPYIVSHLEQVKRAMDSGANVLGYFHWSLMDNYEWQYHYNPESRFGLYQVDRNTDEFKRIPTKGVEALHLIINASNGGEVTDSAVSKAKDRFGAYTPDGSEIVKPSQFLTDNKIISEADISQSNQAQSADSKQMESYRLIIYLDGVSQQNAIRDNFKIVVYNSDNDTILSAKPNIDFNDNHQKISPKSGYTIKGKLGEHPNQITVCAQQEYELNGKKLAHDNCYPIKQNVQKTYWYTIFDYGQIDAFEGDIQSKTELSSQIN